MVSSDKDFLQPINDFHNQIMNCVLKAKNEQDKERFEQILSDRKKWIDEYRGDNKKEVLLTILEKDKEIDKLLFEKKETIKEIRLKDEEHNKNRATYKLYD